jgi:choline-sulfatase
MDRNVGKILDALGAAGLEQDTCVIYTTDHGEMAGENGMWWKYNFYEGSVAVPLIVSHPGRLPQGKKVSEMVSLIDISATLCDMAGTEPMPTSSGRSLAPLLEGRATAWANEALSELPAIGPVPATRMIRSGSWKLVNFDGMRPQLFNLEKDPQEFQDLGADPAYAEVRNELLTKSSENWSPLESREALEYRARNQALIAKWANGAQSEAPSAAGEGLLWRAPADANRFPE